MMITLFRQSNFRYLVVTSVCASAFALSVSCAKKPLPSAKVDPSPAPRVVYVVVTPTSVPEVVAPPMEHGTVETFLIPKPTPAERAPTAIDVGSIPNMDRERDAPAKTLHELMTRCLTYTAEGPSNVGPINVRHIIRAEVKAKNSCFDVSFAGGDCWFELHARDRLKNIVARQTGRFQDPIPPLGGAHTFIEIDFDFGETLDASIWWAAGGGKKAGE